MLALRNMRSRNSRSASIGSGDARLDDDEQRRTATTPTTPVPTTCGDRQPFSGPCDSAYSTSASPAPDSTKPGTSNRPAVALAVLAQEQEADHERRTTPTGRFT